MRYKTVRGVLNSLSSKKYREYVKTNIRSEINKYLSERYKMKFGYFQHDGEDDFRLHMLFTIFDLLQLKEQIFKNARYSVDYICRHTGITIYDKNTLDKVYISFDLNKERTEVDTLWIEAQYNLK